MKQQSVDMTLNGSGVRDIVRGLGGSAATVVEGLTTKAPAVKPVHAKLLQTLEPAHVDIILRPVEQAEMDAM